MSDQTHALAISGDADGATWETILNKAGTLVKSGLLPDAIKTREAAAAIILKGHELRLPAMYSLSNIVVIKGKPACSAELMAALIYRDHGDDALRFVEASDDRCVIEYRRRTWKEPSRYEFTRAQAKQAGLDSMTWKQ